MMKRASKLIPLTLGLLAVATLWSGCLDNVVTPTTTSGGGLKVMLSPQAAAVDHGWLVLDGDRAQRKFMARTGAFLESDPIMVQPGFHLFEITAVDSNEFALFYGQAADTVGQGALALELDIVMRLIAPACSISAGALDFGTLAVGSTSLDTIVISNGAAALGDLEVDVAIDCSAFSVVAGEGAQTLAPGSQLEVIVEFAPTTPGEVNCSLQTGTDCSAVVLTGTGEALPACGLSPAGDSVDFGVVPVGTSTRRTWTLSNTGAGVLQGEVGLEICEGFTLVSGGGPFSLGEGATTLITVEFSPTEDRPYVCALSTETDCGDIDLEGTGQAAPDCAVVPADMMVDFGTLQVGQSSQHSITVTNKGGGQLSGFVDPITCAGYSIVSGGGAYDLAAGETHTVVVEFAPQDAGLVTCELATGSACGSVLLQGKGESLPACGISPAGGQLDFLEVKVGATDQKSFTVTNTGGGILEGTIVPTACDDFAVVAGGGSFALAAGESRVVTVEFAPQGEGAQSCTVGTGTECGAISVRGTGTLDPVCDVVPESMTLDFGSLQVGETALLSAHVTNNGGGVLMGVIQLINCGTFSIVSGGGAYELAAGETRTVKIEFAPSGGGDSDCILAMGSDCGEVTLTGTGVLPPACTVNTATLVFGDLEVGQTAQQGFTVTNTGGGTLEGTIATQACGDFAVVAGAGSFALAAGDSRSVTVEFAPQGEGSQSCTVSTGTQCGGVNISGTGTLDPVCAVVPESMSLDFGVLQVGQIARQTVIMTNTGGGQLSGFVDPLVCAGYSIVVGGGSYSLAAGENHRVVVEFAPQEAGLSTCELVTGTSCGAVTLRGTGEPQPACLVEPSAIDFGTVTVGEISQENLTVTNTGGGTLTGTISIPPDFGFTLVAGAGDFQLAAGESHVVTVAFAPPVQGNYTCKVRTGTECGEVMLTGMGDTPPSCSVDPQTIDFGTLIVGESAQQGFTVTNIGGGVLTGEIGPRGDGFTVIQGAGLFALAGGDSVHVVVEFLPTNVGSFLGCVTTGTPCGVVNLTGSADIPAEPEVLEPQSIDFGKVPLGVTTMKSFNVNNLSNNTVRGKISLKSCAFEILTGGGDFVLPPQQSLTVVVQFTPTERGVVTRKVKINTDDKHDEGEWKLPIRGEGVLPPSAGPGQ